MQWRWSAAQALRGGAALCGAARRLPIPPV